MTHQLVGQLALFHIQYCKKQYRHQKRKKNASAWIWTKNSLLHTIVVCAPLRSRASYQFDHTGCCWCWQQQRHLRRGKYFCILRQCVHRLEINLMNKRITMASHEAIPYITWLPINTGIPLSPHALAARIATGVNDMSSAGRAGQQLFQPYNYTLPTILTINSWEKSGIISHS